MQSLPALSRISSPAFTFSPGTQMLLQPVNCTPVQAVGSQLLPEMAVGNSVKHFTEIQVGNTDYSNLERISRYHWDQCLLPHRANQNSNHILETVIQKLLEFWKEPFPSIHLFSWSYRTHPKVKGAQPQTWLPPITWLLYTYIYTRVKVFLTSSKEQREVFLFPVQWLNRK